MPDVTLVPWRMRKQDVLAIEVTDAQRQFINGTVADFLADDDDHPTFNAFATSDGPTVVGLVSYGQEVGHEAWQWWIPLLAIDHRHQRRGFGRTAMRAVIEGIRNQAPDAEALGLACKPHNAAGLALYRSLCFEPRATNAQGDVVMWLALG